jgi:hypothetical protein
MTKHGDVGDRFTTVSEHHRHIGEHLTTIMARENDRRASTADNLPVRPVRSAKSRRPALPTWATTPVLSPDTDDPADHDVRFTYGVPFHSGP